MRASMFLVIGFIFPVLTRGLVLIDSTIASACIYYELQYDWGCNSHSNGMKAFACRCNNINWLYTVTNCVHNASNSTRLVNHAYRHLATRCFDKTNGVLDYSKSDMVRFFEEGQKFLREPQDSDFTSPVNGTLIVDDTEFQWYYQKFKDYAFSVLRSQWFGWGLVFYWVFIICFSTVSNLLDKIFGFNLATKIIRRKLLIPSVYKNYQERTFFLLKCIPLNFPVRIDALIVLIFVIQTIISVGVGYELTLPHPYLTTRWYMNLNLVSYRVDLMSISLFPMIYLFGMRNNFLIPLTGISFRRFIFYHKWCAYVCVVLAFIHSIIWTVWAISDGGYKVWAMDAYWAWGIAATVLIVLLIFQSESFLRDWMYELFLLVHKLMNIMFIVAMYYHLKPMGWMAWVWSMVAIWSFDRLMRIIRVIINGGLQSALLTDCGNNVIKITLKKPKWVNYKSGQFVYLYFISPYDTWFYAFQSHPFTVLNENTLQQGSEKLTIYLRVNKGLTRVMLERIMKSKNDSLICKVLVEGPYGLKIPTLHKLDRKLVGVSAGLGVTPVFSHFSELLAAQNGPTMSWQNQFYWIINDLNYLSWFNRELQWLSSKGCHVIILYTGLKEKDYNNIEVANTTVFSSTDTITSLSSKFTIQNINKRPDLSGLILEEIGQAEKEDKDITFVSCGPSSFNDDFRYHLSNSLTSKLRISVDYKEESFTW
ncbi:hypothetical protein KAFR_0L01370 [Kazachstania africana CBS 2517]|uniref:ferric-chelate reductase (NADPH) n=1 Tax=Kazachstania africana (strain ATCC 22294 / BCRC 22015 / CBS 2517 / CECT 1963 / NBRC 1671 / NRRL Y-8276) TaxID=1071382 RepID=H2B296_KAZAF|nr:hypothetical protein KAFR_0L01370 [Kazachstania africana CBS 2517]CCF60746.1 hypothetical protein KAFR_0L01370 [Kazachstania africana CBS 2517]